MIQNMDGSVVDNHLIFCTSGPPKNWMGKCFGAPTHPLDILVEGCNFCRTALKDI